jgi:adenine-specific DNA-methyltransferase
METPDKMDLKSMDIADDKCRQLAQLFPEVVTETQTEDGKLVHAVEDEKHKGLLGEFSEILANQREHYGMIGP